MFNGFDLSTIQDAKFGNSQVSSIYYGANLIWPTTPPPHDYSQDYLTFTVISNTATFTFTKNTLQYSIDDGTTWTTLNANTASPTINAGNKILWKQTGLTPGTTNPGYGIGTFSATGYFNASGNVMSLYYGDNFISQTNLTGKDYAFASLFYTCSYLASIENLVLPATTLASSCYSYMFAGCGRVTTAPELTATILTNSCYYYMFANCFSLENAPKLYAPILVDRCYYSMFGSCRSLREIHCYAVDISAFNCTGDWVYDTYTGNGTFYKDANTTWTTGNSGIPSGWTVINI